MWSEATCLPRDGLVTAICGRRATRLNRSRGIAFRHVENVFESSGSFDRSDFYVVSEHFRDDDWKIHAPGGY